MKRLYRALVYLVTFAIPVVIAACYGPAYRYRKGGKVLDKQSRAPISQIDVSCEYDGGSSYPSRTGNDGVFQIQTDETCLELKAVDALGPPGDGGVVDAGVTDAGATDGGVVADGGTDGGLRTARYATKIVPAGAEGADQTIEMDRSN